MADPYKFELVSPEKLLVSEDVEWVVIPGTEGEMTVMVEHAPVMAVLKPGIVRVRFTSGQEEQFVVFGGFADILPDTCTVLAESAVRGADFNRDDLNRRIEQARADLENVNDDEERTQLEEFLHHLATLDHTVLPA